MVSALSKISSARARKPWTSDQTSGIGHRGATYLKRSASTAPATSGGASGSYADTLGRARFRARPDHRGAGGKPHAGSPRRLFDGTRPRAYGKATWPPEHISDRFLSCSVHSQISLGGLKMPRYTDAEQQVAATLVVGCLLWAKTIPELGRVWRVLFLSPSWR
jgi:hypothetical protein